MYAHLNVVTKAGPTEGFTSGQVVSLTGLSYRTVDNWARTRFIIPSINPREGAGIDRLYSAIDVEALRASQLRQKGISTKALRRVVDDLRKQGIEQPLAQARILVAGTSSSGKKSEQDHQRAAEARPAILHVCHRRS